MPSLDARRTPASRDKRPSSPLGLRHLDPVCEHLAYLEANPPTPQFLPHHCEDTAFLSWVKGSPFPLQKTWGGPQVMAFLPAGAGWFRA